MRIVIGDKSYYRPINLSFNIINIHRKINKLFSEAWPWALVFVMFYMMAVMVLRCY
jgi:hypothetical protein